MLRPNQDLSDTNEAEIHHIQAAANTIAATTLSHWPYADIQCKNVCNAPPDSCLSVETMANNV